MTFHIDKARKILDTNNNSIPWYKYLPKLLFILPTMLIILVGIDFLYMFLNMIARLFLLIIKIVTCCKYDYLKDFDDKADKIFEILLNMCFMDIQGFRTQKTIL